jgi:ribonuclease D
MIYFCCFFVALILIIVSILHFATIDIEKLENSFKAKKRTL